jgi:hypothetical protein
MPKRVRLADVPEVGDVDVRNGSDEKLRERCFGLGLHVEFLRIGKILAIGFGDLGTGC